jgi:transposase InsO family protein
VATSLAADGAVESLQMALKKLPEIEKALIHHSDHGSQYASHAYREILSQEGIHPSMGEVGNCYDNIYAERVIGTLKIEYYLDARFTDYIQVRFAVNEAIYYYNTDRPHLSLNMAVPEDVYGGVFQDAAPVVIPESEL